VLVNKFVVSTLGGVVLVGRSIVSTPSTTVSSVTTPGPAPPLASYTFLTASYPPYWSNSELGTPTVCARPIKSAAISGVIGGEL
jgi:hypothetical protein